jgi:hypothetical protein
MLQAAATALLARFDAVTPRDGDELRALDNERGWVEALAHLVRHGMLTEEGLGEAAKIFEASAEWVGGFETDLVLPPAEVVDEPMIVGLPTSPPANPHE